MGPSSQHILTHEAMKVATETWQRSRRTSLAAGSYIQLYKSVTESVLPNQESCTLPNCSPLKSKVNLAKQSSYFGNTGVLGFYAFMQSLHQQIDVSVLCVRPLIDDNSSHDVVKVAVDITSPWQVISTANFDNVIVQFIINRGQTHKELMSICFYNNKMPKMVSCHVKIRGKDPENNHKQECYSN